MAINTMYQIREFLPDNPVEIERMNLMYFHPEVMAAKGYASQDPNYGNFVDLQFFNPEMFTISSSIGDKYDDISYAIADRDNHLIGWIWFYIDNDYPLPRQVARRYGIDEGNSRIYQLSYEKLMSDGWPAAIMDKLKHTKKEHLSIPRKGVVVEGLKLAIERLVADFRNTYETPRNLVLYGYVHPDNIASRKVLQINGFTKDEIPYLYDGVLHELWVRII